MANPQPNDWVTLQVPPSRETVLPGVATYRADSKRTKDKPSIEQRDRNDDFVTSRKIPSGAEVKADEAIEGEDGKQSQGGPTQSVGGKTGAGNGVAFLLAEDRGDEEYCPRPSSRGILSWLPRTAEFVVVTTLDGYARVPEILPVQSFFPDTNHLNFFASHAVSALVVLVLSILFCTRWRTPRSRSRPSAFVIPSGSVFHDPERYTCLRKISVPAFARDYVAGKVEFRDADNPASAMKRLNEWGYFPGGGCAAFLGLVPLWYAGFAESHDDTRGSGKEFATIATMSVRGKNNADEEEEEEEEEAMELDSELFSSFGRMRALFPFGQDVDKMLTLPQSMVYQLDAMCDAWLRLRPDDRLLDLSSACSGLPLHAAEKYGCAVTSVYSTIAGAREATSAAQFSPASKIITVLHGDTFFGRNKPGITGRKTFTKASIINPPFTTSLSRLLRSAHSLLTPRGELLLCLPLLPDTDVPSWPVTEAEHLLAFAKQHGLAVGPTGDGWKTLAETTRELSSCGFELQWASSAGKDMGRLSSRAAREIVAAPWNNNYPSDRLRFSGSVGEGKRRRGGNRRKNASWNAAAHRRGVRRRAWELYLAWAGGAYARGVIEMYWIYSVKKD